LYLEHLAAPACPACIEYLSVASSNKKTLRDGAVPDGFRPYRHFSIVWTTRHIRTEGRRGEAGDHCSSNR